MTPNKNVLFPKEYSTELLKIAEGDLCSALALINSSNPGRVENILYLIQQSVEKGIKAVLVKKQIPFPLLHDLGILIALLPTKDYPPGGFDLTILNPFATVRRYEEGLIPINQEEIEAAYKAAQLVIAWAKSKMSKV